MDDMRDYFDRIPRLRGRQENITVERLGGLTNLVYEINLDDERYILRLAGPGTNEYIDRTVEGYNAGVAAEAGVSADVLFFDESDGLMLASFIEGDTMTPARFANSPGAPARAARALKALHTFGSDFKYRFELFGMIDEYLKVLADLGASLPDGYHAVVEEAESIRRALDAHPAALAPCHCDPLCENFIDNGQRMWVVDWEYSGMNDPLWDLGDLSVEGGFSEALDREMMVAYCGGDYTGAQFGRMVIYKAMCDLLWTLWGLIQHANDNPAEDFWVYSVNRFERCKKLMATPDFAEHLRAVQGG